MLGDGLGDGHPPRKGLPHCHTAVGLRVWFDGYSASEQEWVNEGDEWEWEETCEPSQQMHLGSNRGKATALYAHAEPSLPLRDEYHAVRLRIRSERGDSVQTVRLPADPNCGPVALRSSLSLSAHESSPRKFGKKARMLKSVEDQQVAAVGSSTPAAQQADLSRELMPPPPAVCKANAEDAASTSVSAAEGGGSRHSGAAQKLRKSARASMREAHPSLRNWMVRVQRSNRRRRRRQRSSCA